MLIILPPIGPRASTRLRGASLPAHPAKDGLEEIRKTPKVTKEVAQITVFHMHSSAAGLSAGEPLAPIEAAWITSHALPALIICTQLIVLFALFRIRKHLVCFVDLLKALLGRFIPWIDVRVVLTGQPPIGLLDGLGISVLIYTQDAIIVLVFHNALRSPLNTTVATQVTVNAAQPGCFPVFRIITL